MKISASQPAPETVILRVNYSVEGTEYPAGRPMPRNLVRPEHLAAYEERPGTPRERGAIGPANFALGVSYPVGEDGLPMHTPETDEAEERSFQAQREIEKETWRQIQESQEEEKKYQPPAQRRSL